MAPACGAARNQQLYNRNSSFFLVRDHFRGGRTAEEVGQLGLIRSLMRVSYRGLNCIFAQMISVFAHVRQPCGSML